MKRGRSSSRPGAASALRGGLLVALAGLSLAAARPAADAPSPRSWDGDDKGHTQPPTAKTDDPFSAPTAVEQASRRALEQGLAWLAARERETADGALPSVGAEPSRWAPIGVTAIGALAFMAAGSSPGRGEYGQEVGKMIGALADAANLTPSSQTFGYISRQGDSVSRTHGHGYATLAIAEAYGMSDHDERLARVLAAAVHRIEVSQGAEGGWYYSPLAESAHEGSVTITLVQALRAARNAGITVDEEVIHRADGYVRRLQKDDGTFRYALDSDRSSVGLTAAAIGSLNATGTYDDPAVQAGIDAIFRELDRERGSGEEPEFPFYERLYLAQALWQLSDPAPYQRWWKGERERVLRSQRIDGSWGGTSYGDCYATAVNCLVLAIPDGVLPILQR